MPGSRPDSEGLLARKDDENEEWGIEKTSALSANVVYGHRYLRVCDVRAIPSQKELHFVNCGQCDVCGIGHGLCR